MIVLDLTLKYEQFMDIEIISFSEKSTKYLTDYNRTFISEYE